MRAYPLPGAGTAFLSHLAMLVALGFGTPQLNAQTTLAEPPVAEGAAKEAPSAPASTPRDKAEKEPAGDAKEGSKLGENWVRVVNDEKGKPISMQTAIVRYRSKPVGDATPVEVDLVGAVHVGDTRYYDQLNKHFEQYDALLYELVAPEGTRIARGERASSRHALGAMQNTMKEMLALEHQLEKIDYTKDNFIHADMSPDEFLETMKQRGEGFLQMYFRMVGMSIAMQSQMAAKGKSADAEMMAALFSDDRPRLLKIAMAKQLAEMESLLTAFGGEDGSTIITGRNQKTLKVLRRELEAGKNRIGIFYGAGHLKDMHERLLDEFAMEPVEIEWVDAWDLKPKQAGRSAR